MNTKSNITLFFKFNAVLLCVVNIIFTFVGMFLNFVVIMSLVNSQLRRKVCYFMILILGCFDLVVVVVFHPLITLEIILGWTSTNFTDYIELPPLKHLFVLSFTALSTMTLERYLALVYPFFHQKNATMPRLIAVLILLQLPFAFVFISARFFHSGLGTETTLVVLVGSLFLITFYLNFKLCCIARNLHRRMIIPLGSFDGPEAEGRINVTRMSQTKSKVSLEKTSACVLAVGCLFVCYFPRILVFGFVHTKQADINADETLRIIYLWTTTIVTINSSLNCLIFFYKNSVLRRLGMDVVSKSVCAKKVR